MAALADLSIPARSIIGRIYFSLCAAIVVVPVEADHI